MSRHQPPDRFRRQLGFINYDTRRVGPGVVAAILVIAACVGLTQGNQPVSSFTMPRFGWIGLVLCLNPLIFLLPYLWKPKRSAFMNAAFMTFLLGAINAIPLLSIGTAQLGAYARKT
jgi:hypothetical protein